MLLPSPERKHVFPCKHFKKRDSITSIAIPASIPEILVGSVDGNVRTYDLRMGKKIEDTIGGELVYCVSHYPILIPFTSRFHSPSYQCGPISDGSQRFSAYLQFGFEFTPDGQIKREGESHLLMNQKIQSWH